MLIERLFERRAEEYAHVGTSGNPSVSLVQAFGGAVSSAGVLVNETTAQNIPALYACVRRLSTSVAQLPLKLFREAANGDRQADVDHPLYTVLHDLANPEMSAYDFRDVMQSYLATWAHAFAEIVRNKRGEVTALWPLDPARMTVDRDGLNRLRYRYQMADGRTKDWTFDPYTPPIFHIRYDNGRSPIRRMRETLGLAMASEEMGARFFGHGATPGVILKHPGKLTPQAKQNIRESWDDRFMGSSKAFKTAVLSEGMEITTLTMPLKDAEFMATRKFQVAEIARMYLMPPHMIGDLDRATFSNIEQQAIEYVQHTLMPWLVNWEQAIKRDLMGRRMFNTHTVKFIVNGLLRGDFASRMTGYSVAIDRGILSANEARQLEELNRRSDEGGDAFWMQMNMQPTSVSLQPVAVEPAAASVPAPEPDEVM